MGTNEQSPFRLRGRGMNTTEMQRDSLNPVPLGINDFPESFGSKIKGTILLFDNLDTDAVRRKKSPIQEFPHKTEDVMFILILEGNCTLTVNMEVVVLSAGSVIGIMPNSVFMGKSQSHDIQFCCFTVNSEMYDNLLKTIGVYVGLPDRYARFFTVNIDDETKKSCLQMYTTMKEELREPDYPTKRMVMERYCEIMMLKCIHRVETDKPSEQPELTPSRRVQIYREFLALLEENFRQERSISFYAEKMCLTPKYLSTVVKEVSGKHGSQWIDEYVVMEAKAMIRQGRCNIKQISDALCFPSQSMFGRFFKKMTGYSPKEYKQL